MFTKLTDIVYTDAFGAYVRQVSAERSALVKSGVVSADPRIDQACRDAGYKGRQVALPFWNSLTGEDENLQDGQKLTPAAIAAQQDVAPILRRGKAFGAGDLARSIAGDDPLKNLAEQLADYWNARRQAALFAVLKGVFEANVQDNESDLVLDISGESGGAENLNKDTLLMAAQMLGDAKSGLTAVAMNSMAETALNRLDNAATGFKPSETAGQLSQVNGKSIIVDDACGYNPLTKVAEIYLFGAGAIAINDVPTLYPLEADRDKLGGVDYLVSRWSGICHLRGVAWKGTPVTEAASNAELEAKANWTRVYDKKHVRAVKLICKIA